MYLNFDNSKATLRITPDICTFLIVTVHWKKGRFQDVDGEIQTQKCTWTWTLTSWNNSFPYEASECRKVIWYISEMCLIHFFIYFKISLGYKVKTKDIFVHLSSHKYSKHLMSKFRCILYLRFNVNVLECAHVLDVWIN